MKKEKGQNQEALTQNDKPNGSTPIHPLVTGQCAEIMTYKGQSAPNPPFLATCRRSILFWGHGSGAKENAPTVPAYVSTALRLPDPPLVFDQWNSQYDLHIPHYRHSWPYR